ncbi:MAG: hypothetical protein V3S98_10500, partial [Dehalococcoidia bacterium]
RWAKRGAIGLGVLLGVLVVSVVLLPQPRAAAKTLGLVVQVVPGFPVKPLSWFTGEPVKEAITYPVGDAAAEADIYRIPDGKPRAAVVLFLGVNPAGRDDERVVNLASGLARAGFVVLVPWSRNMIEKRVDPEDIDMLVAAFQHLGTLDYVDPDRIGGGGFCVGSSMVAVAAADPRIRDNVAFVNFFSGFYDARDYLVQLSARQSFYRGASETWEPDSLALEVFAKLLIEGLEDDGERELLGGHFADGERLSSEQTKGLTPAGDAVYRLLSGTGLAEARELLSSLPPDVQTVMDALSPSLHVQDLSARLLIMHDREDDLVPVEESRRLADATADREGVRYTEFSFFQHVDPTERVGAFKLVTESLKLFGHLYGVVRTAT